MERKKVEFNHFVLLKHAFKYLWHFGMIHTIELYSSVFTDYIFQSVSYQKKDWGTSPDNPFLGYDNDKDL